MPFRICLPLLVVCSCLALAESGPNPLAVAPGELIQQTYAELRSIAVDPSRVATAENVEIHKGPARFTLRNGQIAMLKAVAGRTVGAVFVGEGSFAFTAENELEKSQTARYNDGQAALDEPFDRLVMLFTGDEAGKLESQAKFSAGSISAGGAGILDDLRKMFRKRLRTNIEAQTLASVVSGEDLFLALLHGKRNGDLIFSIDPFEAEEVSLVRIRGEAAFDVWNSFPLADREPGAHQGDLVDTIHVTLNTLIQTNANIQCDAGVTFRALRSGPRMLPFRLAPKLRVTEATDGSTSLRFIQESEKEDADLWVLLPAALEKDREYTWRFRYGGEDVVQKAGQGNFYVGARTSWYPKPDVANEFFTDLATYRMRFEVPRKNTLVATGKLLRRATEGKSEVSEWETGIPYTVAGFNYGQFKVKTLQHAGYEVSVYTNPQLNDELNELRVLLEQNPDAATQLGITTGGLNTTRMAEKIGAEAAQSLALFSAYFGEIPYKSITVSQQPSGVFGQSWPSLVFYPYSGLLDSTMKNQLGLDRQHKSFFDEVGPHEIAHQWWGHMAPWKDYHQQWLSEGIAEFSAGLYLHHFHGEDRFRTYLKGLREQILISRSFSQRPTDVGPIWLGYRLESEKTRGAYRLVYSKGAYVMHMLRMMLFNHVQKRDDKFRSLMRDFVQTVKNRPATTSDLAAVCNKHFGFDMSWFFRQWVLGTAYPKAEIAYKVEPAGDKRKLFLAAQLSDVPQDFLVHMPVLIHFKQSVSSGVLKLTGKPLQTDVTLPEEPVRVEFNPLDSVLCDLNVRKM